MSNKPPREAIYAEQHKNIHHSVVNIHHSLFSTDKCTWHRQAADSVERTQLCVKVSQYFEVYCDTFIVYPMKSQVLCCVAMALSRGLQDWKAQ